MTQRGWAAPPKVPKLRVSSVKNTAKIDKDLDMSYYIQVEYSIFSIRTSLYDHVKIILKNI